VVKISKSYRWSDSFLELWAAIINGMAKKEIPITTLKELALWSFMITDD